VRAGFIATGPEQNVVAPRLREAERLLRAALRHLEEYPREAEGLHGSISQACRLQGKLDAAVAEAKLAVAIKPVGASEHLLLAQAYFELRDFGRAQEELRTSLDIEPLNADTRRFISNIYWDHGMGLRDHDARRREFERLIVALEDVIETEPDPSEAGELHYWAGLFNGELMRSDQAISHLKIALFSGALPLQVRVFLGWNYLDQQAFNEAESVLREMVAMARLRRCHPHPAGDERTSIDAITDPDPLNKSLVQGYLLLGRVYAERGKDIARSERSAACAKRYLDYVAPTERPEIEAFYWDTLGWIHHLAERDEEALTAAEASVRLRSDGERYYHLASITLALARVRPSERVGWLRRTKESCDQAVAADLQGAFVKRVAALRKEADDLAKPRQRPARRTPKKPRGDLTAEAPMFPQSEGSGTLARSKPRRSLTALSDGVGTPAGQSGEA
jgi:tetratricopeptide (TPR) repeat protein